MIKKDRDVIFVSLDGRIGHEDDGTFKQSHCVINDITERKHAEEIINESEHKYRSLVETAQELIWKCDEKGCFTYLNPAWELTHGYKVEEMLGRSFGDFQPKEIFDRDVIEFSRHMAGGFVKEYETIHIAKDGRVITLLFNAIPLVGKDGAISGTQGTAIDITERKQAEAALLESEERYRELIEGTNNLVTRVDNDGRFTFVNSVSHEVFGISPEECTGLLAFDFIHPDDKDKTEEWFSAWQSSKDENNTIENRQLNSKTGEIHHMLWSCHLQIDDDGSISGINSIARDITERKQAEEEKQKFEARFQEAQKRESLSILAGGIAHDFNNLLSAIMGNAALTLMEISPVSPVRKKLEDIAEAGKLAADLTNQMLAYSGRGHFITKDFDLSALVREMISLLKSSISKKAQINMLLDGQLPTMRGDLSQVRQLAMNLIINASEALDEKSGTVTLRTGAKNLNESEISKMNSGLQIEPGDYVYLSVEDDGCGIDEQSLKKIFDPFYSTKFTGRGLGLAATLGIIEGHQGALQIETSLSQGSTFIVFFPVSGPHVQQVEIATKSIAIGSGLGTVLLVEDEPVSLRFGKRTLEKAGYEVLSAVNGQEGVDVLRKNIGKISLVLLDNKMPVLNGYEAFIEMRKIDPDVTVILVSGYIESIARKEFEGEVLSGFIQKPYRPSQLIEVVEDILNP